MNRRDLRELTRVRLREARVLLRANEWSGAYYLCGYAVECALKACIARQFKRFEFPDKKMVNDSYTHHLPTLVRIAGLEQKLNQQTAADPKFSVNWAVVKDWSESSRYDVSSAVRARDMLAAVAGPKHGVLPWVRQQW